MKKSLQKLLLLLLVFAFYACNTTEGENPKGEYSNGFFIVNEGAFTGGIGTISFFDYEKEAVEDDIFEKVNGRPLGNVVQSMEIFNNKGYIVVNNSEKVEVVNPHTFKSEGVINELKLPRYFVGINENKGYVTEWGEGFVNGAVKVINLKENKVEKTVSIGLMPEKLLRKGNHVYVVNSGSATVSVINISNDELLATIEVADSPNSLQIDAEDNLWVLCGGHRDWSNPSNNLPGSLFKISTATHEILERYDFESAASSPSNLLINKENKLIFRYSSSVYIQPSSEGAFNPSLLVQKSFYGIGMNAVKNWLIGADAADYSGNGKIFIYNADDGSEIGSYTVGVIPNSIAVYP